MKSETAEYVSLRSLATGLKYAKVAAGYGEGPPVTTHILRLDPSSWALRHVAARELGGQLGDAGEFRQARNAAAAINGIYFDPKFKPLGLMVSAGKQLSRLRRVDHGVFTIAADGPGLQHARQWQEPEGLDFAAECGPRLVVDGAPLQFKPGLARRTALGFDAKGHVYVVVTSGVVGLQDFANFLARPHGQRGLGLKGALNLDGGSSTMLDLAWGGAKASVRSAVRVPAGIAVVARKSPSPIAQRDRGSASPKQPGKPGKKVRVRPPRPGK
ncbi:MAG: phosphodiester glycosidase family protein [Myxococcales bacterium]|nr:phosphodiester glycosidase family protein [Myxococcales bacterium]